MKLFEALLTSVQAARPARCAGWPVIKPAHRLIFVLCLLGLLVVFGESSLRTTGSAPANGTPPRLVFIAPDAQGSDQLFLLPSLRDQPAQLTQENFGVWDYSVAPDGMTITYAALRQDGGSDLWQIASDGSSRKRLVECPEAACSGAVWSPDSSRLVYEVRKTAAPETTPGSPRLWWLDSATNEAVPVLPDNVWPGYGARWSPDGRWLSFVSPGQQGIRVFHVGDGRSFLIPGHTGSLAVWSPGGEALLVSDIKPQEERFAVHLLKADPSNGQLVDLSGQTAQVEDGSPAWSPDGRWIAFTRKVAGAAMGQQIWLMRPDGSQAHYLTNDTAIQHGLPAWSPDSRYLLYQRYPLQKPGAQPGVWLFDLQTGDSQEVAAPGNRPAWLP